MLSGVSLSANRFFYDNPLESNGQHQRQAWFGCACCPSNIARFVPAIPGYVYAVSKRDLYVNLFISNDADINVGKRKVQVSQKANFPWDGKVEITVSPESAEKFSMKIRIPGWAVNEAMPGDLYRFEDKNDEQYKILLNGEAGDWKTENGYVEIERKWKKGDRIDIDFPMAARKVVADNRITSDMGKIAIQRGPVIYCAEWPDNNTGNVLNLLIDNKAPLTAEFEPSLLEGTEVIKTSGFQTKKKLDGTIEKLPVEPVTLIPYALWNNRGPGQMMVWLPVTTEAAHPLPAPAMAYQSKLRAGKMTRML
jgi:DUF1680 family protein